MKYPTRSKRNEPKRAIVHAAATCEDATNLIGDYLADNVDLQKRRAFEAHLSGCPDCAAFLATYKRTIGLTQSFLALQSLQAPPIDFKLRLPSAR